MRAELSHANNEVHNLSTQKSPITAFEPLKRPMAVLETVGHLFRIEWRKTENEFIGHKFSFVDLLIGMERRLLEQMEKKSSGLIEKLTTMSKSLNEIVAVVEDSIRSGVAAICTFSKNKRNEKGEEELLLEWQTDSFRYFLAMHSCNKYSKKTLFSWHPQLLNLVMCPLKGIAELGHRQFHLRHQEMLCLEYSVLLGKESKGEMCSSPKFDVFFLVQVWNDAECNKSCAA